jgi:hypothetical protein
MDPDCVEHARGELDDLIDGGALVHQGGHPAFFTETLPR